MKNKRKRLIQMRDMCRPFIRAFATISLLVLCSQGIGIAITYVYGRIVDAATVGSGTDRVWWLVALALAVLALGRVIDWTISRLHIDSIIFDMEIHFNRVTMGKVSKLSIGQITNQNSGYKQDVIKKGETAVAEMANTLFMEAVPALFRLVASTVALFFLSGLVGFVTAASAACFIAVSVLVNQGMIPRIKKSRKWENKLGTKYWEAIKHLRLVTVSNQERRMVGEYSKEYDSYSRDGKSLWDAYVGKVTFLREPFAVVGQIGALVASLYLVRRGSMSVGDLVIALGWSATAFGALGSIGSMQRRIVRYYVLIAKYFDLLEIPPAITVVESPVRPPSYSGRIEFKGVSFTYPKFEGNDKEDEEEAQAPADQPAALQDVSFAVDPGKVTAFVGHSGSGKSTAINLILRGYDPTEGQILVDGHDLRLLDLGHWRKSIGIVEQDPKLWDETVRYNITYGLNGEASLVTEEELDALARRTRIDEFYHRLGPKRFETLIGENGVQLSGGQRQRVAIARAIIRSPSLLILDEATNALDPMNEHLVHEAIREAMVGRTGIIIAHRLSTIRNADKIVVFEGGRIAGIGTHNELMGGCLAYQALVMREVGTLSV